jgi:Zn-dependent M28 family amino/carboxypeptidase
MGEFGSRGGRGKLHPGADDNASGAAALILLADRLVDAYANLPEDAEARSILIVAFSAEESGLNGSRHYVQNPIRPLERHALMINFDMIGRIVNNRLAVTGVETAVGLEALVQPFFDASPLDVVTSRRGGGGSDHLPFLQREVPALFAILADIREHPDYHTPGDTSDKINRVAALQTVDLFEDIALAAATHAEPFAFQADAGRPTAAGAPRVPGVRLGFVPAAVEGGGLGILIGDVSADTAADEAGIRTGDLMVRWNGAKIEDVSSWMATLGEHSPGDEVQVGLRRDGEEITVTVKLRGR